MRRTLSMILSAALGVLVAGAQTSGKKPCPWDPAAHRVKDIEQKQDKVTECLLRSVHEDGTVDNAYPAVPPELVKTGDPSPLKKQLVAYLKSKAIHAEDLGIPDADLGTGPPTHTYNALYFVIHDTSTPNLLDKDVTQQADIKKATWTWKDIHYNDPNRYKCCAQAHVYITRDGQSASPRFFYVPWRATRYEIVAGDSARGYFVHVDLVQPRSSKDVKLNDNFKLPEPPFEQEQYDRLAQVYVAASIVHGRWLIPAYCAVLDVESGGSHNNPLGFKLDVFATSVSNVFSAVKSQQP